MKRVLHALYIPVGYIYVYDASFQQFSIQISAGSQEPTLVMG